MAHRRLGKIIVAGAAEAGRLEGIAAAAAANGVDDLAPLDAGDLARMEPALRGVAGLLSPSTGIIDSHGYMLALQGEAEDHGAVVALRTAFLGAEPRPGGGFVVDESATGADRVVQDDTRLPLYFTTGAQLLVTPKTGAAEEAAAGGGAGAFRQYAPPRCACRLPGTSPKRLPPRAWRPGGRRCRSARGEARARA